MKPVAGLILGALNLLGCISYQHAEVPLTGTFELLYQRRLADFAHRIAIAHHSDDVDEWIALADAWLAFANCDDIESSPTDAATASDPLATILRDTLLLESLRRRTDIAHSLQRDSDPNRFARQHSGEPATQHTGQHAATQDRLRPANTLFAQLEPEGFFHRKPKELPDDLIRWPDEAEEWIDELPAPMPVTSRCRQLVQSMAASHTQQTTAANSSHLGAANGQSADAANSHSSDAANNHSSSAANGHAAGTANGHSAGAANGHSAGTANGHSAGAANGHSQTDHNWRDAQFPIIDRILARGQELIAIDKAPSGNVAALLWRVRFHGAATAHGLRRQQQQQLARAAAGNVPSTAQDVPSTEAQAVAHRAAMQRYARLTRHYLGPLVAADVTAKTAVVTAAEHARAFFLRAVIDIEGAGIDRDSSADVAARNWSQAIAWLDKAATLAGDSPKPGGNQFRDHNLWAARYLRLRLLSRAANWSRATAMSNAIPPRDSMYHGAYVYRLAVAAKRHGAEDRFLAIAMAAFRDKPYQSDPHLRALYWQVLGTLAQYPFEPRIVEIVEDLGSRSKTFHRIEELARVALDRGHPNHAEAAANWLLRRHANARYRPKYHALRALAAFLKDDANAFRRAVADMTRRPAELLAALPTQRRAAFFAHADKELTRILRQMLPIMAEWGETKSAHARRQKWLTIIVEETQAFLRNAEESLVRPALIELYRVASALLKAHPRGYAERVGATEPTPLVLGTVRVAPEDLAAHEPAVDIQIPATYSLTLLPRDAVPAGEWTFGWPDMATNKQTTGDTAAAEQEADHER